MCRESCVGRLVGCESLALRRPHRPPNIRRMQMRACVCVCTTMNFTALSSPIRAPSSAPHLRDATSVTARRIFAEVKASCLVCRLYSDDLPILFSVRRAKWMLQKSPRVHNIPWKHFFGARARARAPLNSALLLRRLELRLIRQNLRIRCHSASWRPFDGAFVYTEQRVNTQRVRRFSGRCITCSFFFPFQRNKNW